MAKEYCPNCGQPMNLAAKDKNAQGKWVLIYVCPNKAGCGTIVHKEE